MTLRDLIAILRRHDLLVSFPSEDVPITALAVDSREVRPGTVFIAHRGSVADGHAFVGAAVGAGAVAVIAERELPEATVPVVVVHDGRRAAERLAAAWYEDPASALTIVAVTGTNGKTTTTALVRHLLGLCGAAGSIGTLGAFDGEGRAIDSTAGTLTTPGPLDLQRTLRGLVDAGVTQVAMEASSHALHQQRLDALTFAGAVFTNLTRDHLDYHGSMEAYRDAKLRLAQLVAVDGTLAVNADDPAWATLSRDRRTIRWGHAPDAELRVAAMSCLASGSAVTFDGRFGRAEVSIPLPGDFNVANAAGAAAVALGMGFPFGAVMARLATLPQVPGRMERIADAPCPVLRDYAHTPDALERALATLRPITPGRIILVFGCGGDRDRGKRPMMGQVAVAGADLVLVTSDNPRTEDPERIIDDIVADLPADSCQRESDRTRAIAAALDQARPGDVVLLAGKGHETYQVIGTTKQPFDERTIVRGILGQ